MERFGLGNGEIGGEVMGTSFEKGKRRKSKRDVMNEVEKRNEDLENAL